MIRKHDVLGPRYTSYPTADRFSGAFGEAELRRALSARTSRAPWSIYMHLPFCDTLCYYCACNKVITRDHGKSAKYVEYLVRELELLEPQLGERANVSQLHWGGGTPTFLAREEMRAWSPRSTRASSAARTSSARSRSTPGACSRGTLAFLGELGFNRVSIGVQDFDREVQRAVHRIQSEE